MKLLIWVKSLTGREVYEARDVERYYCLGRIVLSHFYVGKYYYEFNPRGGQISMVDSMEIAIAKIEYIANTHGYKFVDDRLLVML